MFEVYKSFEAWAKYQFSACILKLQSDWGSEYTSKKFINHLVQKGTEHRLTVHDTLKYNGVAEHSNFTILKKMCVIMHTVSLPKFLWAKAVRHTVYLKNRTLTCVLSIVTPFKMLYSCKPDLQKVQT